MVSRDWITKLKKKTYERLTKEFYDKVWPQQKEKWKKDIQAIMGERRFGVFGAYEEEGNGWEKMEFLAQKIASERGHSVLTGKGIFKATLPGKVDFIPIVFDPTPHLVSVEDYAEWLASLVTRAVVFLGKTRSTAEIEEKALAELETPTAGVAVIEEYSGEQNCSKLEVRKVSKFSICQGGIGDCEDEKYCPFGKKGIGIPYGRLDLYCRTPTMHLVAVSQKENITHALSYIELL